MQCQCLRRLHAGLMVLSFIAICKSNRNRHLYGGAPESFFKHLPHNASKMLLLFK